MIEAAREVLGAADGSIITAWEDQSREHLLIALITNKKVPSITESLSSGASVNSDVISNTHILDYVPSDSESSYPTRSQITIGTGWGNEANKSFRSQARKQYRTSQQMADWGCKYPAYWFEHWVEDPPIANPDPADYRLLLNRLEQLFDLRLEEHRSHFGNVITAIENRRARISMHSTENSEELFAQRRQEGISQEQKLDLAQGWTVNLRGIDRSQIDLVLRRQEYGTLLEETRVDLAPENELSIDEAAEYGAHGQSPHQLLVVSDRDGSHWYESPRLNPPGASNETIRVSMNGVMIDEHSFNVIRTVNPSLDILNAPQGQPAPDTPPALNPDPDYTIGDYSWEERLADFGVSVPIDTWTVDTDEEYEEVMELVHNQLSGLVKILDPYLQPGQLSDFIDEAGDNCDIWVIVGHNRSYMSGMRGEFEDCLDKAGNQNKGLHITWAPHDERTPLHDRFLLNTDIGLTFGTSFNSIDGNFTMVSEVSGGDASILEEKFDEWWSDPVFKREFSVELIGSTADT